jgi:hypothetical protein
MFLLFANTPPVKVIFLLPVPLDETSILFSHINLFATIAIKKYPDPFYSLLPDGFKFNIEDRTITYRSLKTIPEYGKGFDLSTESHIITFDKMEKLFIELTSLWKLDISVPVRSKIEKARKENNLKARINYKKLINS